VHWQENNSKSAELFRMASNKCLLNVDMPTFSQLTSAADDNLKVWFTHDTLQVLCAWNPTSVWIYRGPTRLKVLFIFLR